MFKVLTNNAICADEYPIYRLMLNMLKVFDSNFDCGTLLHKLGDILNPDELHLASLLLGNVKLQVKHNNICRKMFTPDIGSPKRRLYQSYSTFSIYIKYSQKHTHLRNRETPWISNMTICTLYVSVMLITIAWINIILFMPSFQRQIITNRCISNNQLLQVLSLRALISCQ